MRIAHLSLIAALALSGAACPSLASDAGPDAATPGAREPGSLDPAILSGLPTALVALNGAGRRQGLPTAKAAARMGYKPLSDLTGGAYPAFSPGIGAVYAKRESLPSGPFLAFDHKGRQVSTIYKFSLDKMTAKGNVEARGARMPPVDHVGGHFSGSHPGVDFPHYSIVLWHVPKKDEARVAK